MRSARMLTIRSCVAAALVLVPVAIQAQTQPPQTPLAADSVERPVIQERPEIVELPVIEVIGRSPGAILRQTGTVQVVSREEMEVLQPISTEDALRRLPGINSKTEEETAIEG